MAEEIMASNTPFGIEAYRALWAETVASVLSQFTGATLTPGSHVFSFQYLNTTGGNTIASDIALKVQPI